MNRVRAAFFLAILAAGSAGSLLAALVRDDDTATDKPDGRGSRLLFVIAAICVLGVTTAIIRAIVAQRASRVVST